MIYSGIQPVSKWLWKLFFFVNWETFLHFLYLPYKYIETRPANVIARIDNDKPGRRAWYINMNNLCKDMIMLGVNRHLIALLKLVPAENAVQLIWLSHYNLDAPMFQYLTLSTTATYQIWRVHVIILQCSSKCKKWSVASKQVQNKLCQNWCN